ncbi:methyltransferase domain-containing protein [Rhodoblastus acidophilus]|uniref:Methyltransferase domain-containing protein n=1 Tax=Rhodoblastus acidophilus TaxID=1074 RepID=A0A6N8DKH2_RHOAC|nr:class I SAM-dependent methyltransferase [Rhodoblastus acidophilus]MCW2272832.1 ubiquinone/menaquinone biosynthesis C-methylase UbiE [Rhodoblastus acidophilus]MTV29741.1 methyltransferase domain-containing protein [Rhodoblastus acidophilus]
MNTVIECHPSANLKAVKARQQAAWSSGDYAVIGATLQIVGENLAEALDLRAGQKILDVAAGNGNVTLAAARRWCKVTSTDYVQTLLDRGRARAEADGFDIDFRTADAEDLPFPNETFDAVVSTFGVMFSPDQSRAAAELARVCKRGGKIGLANWTPDGFVGQLFKTIGKHLPPPAGVKSPAIWGTRDWLEASFAPSQVVARKRAFVFRYLSAQHFVDTFRAFYGPALKAFEALDASGREALAGDIIELIGRFNISGDDSMVVPSDYLEVVVSRQ